MLNVVHLVFEHTVEMHITWDLSLYFIVDEGSIESYDPSHNWLIPKGNRHR